MSPDELRTEAAKVLMFEVGPNESVSHILARLWSAGSPASRALRAKYNEASWKGPINDLTSSSSVEFNLNWADENPDLFARDVREFQQRYPITHWRHKIDLSRPVYMTLVAIRRPEPFDSVKDFLDHENGKTFLRETTCHD